MRHGELVCLVLASMLLAGGRHEKSSMSAPMGTGPTQSELDARLRTAAADGNVEQVRLLVADGADISARGPGGQTALHIAAAEGDANVATLLLERGADVDATDEIGRTPLHEAARAGRLNLVEQLVNAGANVNARTTWNILKIALYARRWEANKTPLAGAKMGREDIARFLIDHGATATIQQAVRAGALEAVKRKLKAGIDVRARQGYRDTTLLHEAALYGHGDVIEFLIASGADVNAEASITVSGRHFPSGGRTPLHHAASAGHKDATQVLIAHGANVNARDLGYKARTPLYNAIEEGHQNLVELLIAHGAEVDYGDEAGITPLHTAASCGDKSIVELLMTRGANVHAADKEGKTPLHMAAYYGHTAIAELLVSVGADPHARAANGQTPLDYAEEAGFADTVAAFGGDPNDPSLAQKGRCTIIVTKADYVEDFLKSYYYDFDNVWIPKQADLVGLESILESCLRGNPPIRTGPWYGQRQMLINLRRYSRWCSGFVKDGTKYIVCVMYLDNSFGRPTYSGFACVMDGGWTVLRVIFNLDDGTVAYIECNPSA